MYSCNVWCTSKFFDKYTPYVCAKCFCIWIKGIQCWAKTQRKRNTKWQHIGESGWGDKRCIFMLTANTIYFKTPNAHLYKSHRNKSPDRFRSCLDDDSFFFLIQFGFVCHILPFYTVASECIAKLKFYSVALGFQGEIFAMDCTPQLFTKMWNQIYEKLWTMNDFVEMEAPGVAVETPGSSHN